MQEGAVQEGIEDGAASEAVLAGMQAQPGAAEAPQPAAAPAEVLGAGPGAPAVIEATPTSFSDASH